MLAGDIATTRWMNDPKNLDAVASVGTITGVSQDIAKGAAAKYIKMQLVAARTTRAWARAGSRGRSAWNVKLGNIPNNAVTWKSVVDTRMWKAAYKLVTGKKYTAKAAKAG